MIVKEAEKKDAIRLRKQGKTYSEILAVIPVAKSTLSLWLHEIGIAKHQLQKFTEKKRLAGMRGGEAKKKQRINRQNDILSSAKLEIGKISKRELFLLGATLYWAEGTKEKEWRPGSGVVFTNMDPRMIKIFLTWLSSICKIEKDVIVFDIFLHETHANRVDEVKKYWAKVAGIHPGDINRIYFKRNISKVTNRRNTEEKYFGVLKMTVLKSSELVRKIAGWTEGIIENIK